MKKPAPQDQPDLFGPAPAAPVWTPDPDKVRRRLERILAEARAAQTMPWDSPQRSLFKKIFPDMANLLPAGRISGTVYLIQNE
jgi:hypothetical protein